MNNFLGFLGMGRVRGFSLLELMIAVAIVGILSAIALPAYQNYVLRGNRLLAKTTLQTLASQQENFYLDRKQYGLTLVSLGYPADPFYVGKNGTPAAASTNALYTVSISNASAVTFTFTATALAGSPQAADSQCATLSINHLGVRSATGGGGSDCWTR